MSTFALSMGNTTLLPTLPKVSHHHVSGFSATTTKVQQLKAWRNARMSVIVAQSSSSKDDGGSASVKVKYDKILKEMRPVCDNLLNARMKRLETRTGYTIAHEEDRLAYESWGKQKREVIKLLRELVEESSPSSEDVASLCDKSEKELEPAVNYLLKAGIRKAEKRKELNTAQAKVELTNVSWENMLREITELQRQLGIIANKSSSEDDGFASLKLKYFEVVREVSSAGTKYRESMTGVKLGKEESLAWESVEKKKLELLELQMQMYILRPGMSFAPNDIMPMT